MRVAAYYRVSTARQAEKDLSIPDQQRQAQEYCKKHAWVLVREFVEPGATATNDNRPAFQALIDFACGKDKPIDTVIVHSFSRFFRDNFDLEYYRRRLKCHGVSLVSITQEISDGPEGDLLRTMVTSFDAYSSAENGKHTLRAMRENARQGFWNGGKPPFGYNALEAGKRGEKAKKKLAIQEDEAMVVRKIFDLYTRGDGAGGPMGVKAIVNHLNARGITRRGQKFYKSNVHDILKRTTYIGTHYFNRIDSKTRQEKPREEWIALEVPPIIEKTLFEKVQKTLKAKSPKNAPPRVVSSPTLLTGLLKCASCGGSMVLRTGKGGQYRYYTCSTCAQKGKTACPGRTIPMGTMDDIVLEQLAKMLFTPERLYVVLSELMDRSQNGKEAQRQKLAGLNKEHAAKETALSSLYNAIELGVADAKEPNLCERINKARAYRDELAKEMDLLNRQINNTNNAITPEKLEAFATLMHDKLFNGDTTMRKAYINLFVERIELDDGEIRIQGSKIALAQGASTPEKLDTSMVPSFVREWHALRECNNLDISIS